MKIYFKLSKKKMYLNMLEEIMLMSAFMFFMVFFVTPKNYFFYSMMLSCTIFYKMLFLLYVVKTTGFYHCIYKFKGYSMLLKMTSLSFFVDGLSMMFLLLTIIIFQSSLMYSLNYMNDRLYKFYVSLIAFMNFFLIVFFSTSNILMFYVCFESVLAPVFLLIVFFGSSSSKILAAYYFLMYTFMGSVSFLFSMLVMLAEMGSLNMHVMSIYLYDNNTLQYLLWPMIFIAFAVKMPMVPFHIWLPEAHVEAPTIGSVYLASLLLKLGGYGMMSMLLEMFPTATWFYTPFVQAMALFSMMYSSLVMLVQSDMKSIIAYSSITHMNFSVLGIFTFNAYGLNGAIYSMMAHGITSSALFFLVGMLYDSYKTRDMSYYGGFVVYMPIFSFFFFVFCLANTGFPGTMNFMGELLLMLGIITYAINTKLFAVLMLVFISVFSSVCYSMPLINSIIFGNVKWTFNEAYIMMDMTISEISVIFPFFLWLMLFGVHSKNVLYLMDTYSGKVLINYVS